MAGQGLERVASGQGPVRSRHLWCALADCRDRSGTCRGRAGCVYSCRQWPVRGSGTGSGGAARNIAHPGSAQRRSAWAGRDAEFTCPTPVAACTRLGDSRANRIGCPWASFQRRRKHRGTQTPSAACEAQASCAAFRARAASNHYDPGRVAEPCDCRRPREAYGDGDSFGRDARGWARAVRGRRG
jgi:hypothetical protein